MVQTTNRFFDEMARLMNDAAGVAQGARREFDTMVRAQAERFLRNMDLVKREEFEAVKEMARLAREESEDLKARVAALEAKQGAAPFVTPPPRATPTTMSASAPGITPAAESPGPLPDNFPPSV
jgi:BMFP domain-containing protein YqiC